MSAYIPEITGAVYAVTVPVTSTPTLQHDRVRAVTFCPRCFGTKDQGLLVCWPCHARLKRAYDGGYGRVMERRLVDLDIYLFDHTDRQALTWLGET